MKKCYIDEAALFKAHAYVLRLKFNDKDNITTVAMKIPSMVYYMQITNKEYMRILFPTRMQEFFRLKPDSSLSK